MENSIEIQTLFNKLKTIKTVTMKIRKFKLDIIA